MNEENLVSSHNNLITAKPNEYVVLAYKEPNDILEGYDFFDALGDLLDVGLSVVDGTTKLIVKTTGSIIGVFADGLCTITDSAVSVVEKVGDVVGDVAKDATSGFSKILPVLLIAGCIVGGLVLYGRSDKHHDANKRGE